jgi:hypothetical protein
MLKYRRIIQDSARRIATAANRAVEAYITDGVESEPDFVEVMLGRMKLAMDGYKNRGLRWTARTLSSKAQKVQGSGSGADFLGVVEFDLPECSVRKGFLAQARHIERGQTVTTGEWERLAEQCRQMVSVTAESFVFIYSRSGITVVPALAIASATAPGNPHDFYSRTALRFYQDHFECFVGDVNLLPADAPILERLGARHALYLGASQIQPADMQMKLGAQF